MLAKGLLAVVSCDDAVGPFPSAHRARMAQNPLEVRHVGDPVALVVAETWLQAKDAAEPIEVDDVAQGAGVRVGVTGAKSHAFRATALEAARAQSFTPAAAKAVKLPADDMNSDLHGTAAYRAAMVSVMAARAAEKALSR